MCYYAVCAFVVHKRCHEFVRYCFDETFIYIISYVVFAVIRFSFNCPGADKGADTDVRIHGIVDFWGKKKRANAYNYLQRLHSTSTSSLCIPTPRPRFVTTADRSFMASIIKASNARVNTNFFSKLLFFFHCCSHSFNEQSSVRNELSPTVFTSGTSFVWSWSYRTKRAHTP